MDSAKKSKVDETDSDSSEDMAVEDGDEIEVDFEGFPLLDQDFDGVKQLLAQQFTESSSIKLRSFAEALIGQNYIGTVVKQSESPEDGRDISTDDDVLALVSCYSIARPKDELRDSIVGYLLSKCKESNAKLEIKEDFMKVINESMCSDDASASSTCVGLIINERIVNVPPQVTLPMFERLAEEIPAAQKRKHKVRYDFTHYVMLCKTYELTSGESLQKKDDLFPNAEEELFASEATSSFDYKLPASTDGDEFRSRRAILLTQEGFDRSLKLLKRDLSV